jgi:hypothetical protein
MRTGGRLYATLDVALGVDLTWTREGRPDQKPNRVLAFGDRFGGFLPCEDDACTTAMRNSSGSLTHCERVRR